MLLLLCINITLIDTENDFNFIPSYLLNRPTITEQQIVSRIAKAMIEPGIPGLYPGSVYA